ncbi:DUF72 domain-containing protein [Geobacter sp.]|uniref:DUF72 domain-containing protein n=1 Tax=Geobacter sp. TaxID=46610 RepID=UPI00262077F5|nr:DUF72 domain-containing protein [Geobacter sp.]
MELRIGCCGFPVARERYVSEFDVVEIQQTFYHPPRVETARKWRASVPSGFEFTVKAWQLITHPPESPTYRRLKRKIPPAERERYGLFRPTGEVFAAWDETLRIAGALAARLVLFQSPPRFTPTAEHLAHMRRFFSSIDRAGLLLAWEPRGDWPAETVRGLCRDLGLIHCVDPFRNDPLAGTPLYLRLHGRDGYRYRYTDEELAALLRRLAGWGRPAYVMFNNVYMHDDALRFVRMVGGE